MVYLYQIKIIGTAKGAEKLSKIHGQPLMPWYCRDVGCILPVIEENKITVTTTCGMVYRGDFRKLPKK